jgi:large subunit ribosomal protein L11
MAKKITAVVKIVIPAGKATPAPPVGTALGPHGIQIMEFVNQFNEKTKDQMGNQVPALITIYEDRSFTFILKKPPVTDMIKRALKLQKASSNPKKEEAGSLSPTQLETIAQEKMPDLNTKSLEQAKKIVAGTARSMGISIKD